MTDTVSNLHVRHDPDGDGPVCYEFTGTWSRVTQREVDEWVRDGRDVHPADQCPHTGASNVPTEIQ